MSGVRLRTVFVLLAAAAAVAALSASAGTSSSPGLAALRICGDTSLPQPLAGYRYVVLGPLQYSEIAEIKRRSPATKVRVYKDMPSTRDYEPASSALATGAGYAYANRYHPEWFPKGPEGHRAN